MEKLGGQALPLACDVRSIEDIKNSIEKTMEKFGQIDFVISNASAIKMKTIEDISMKEFDLMNQVNFRGTFALIKEALPHLKKSSTPHILTLSPPLFFDGKWFESSTAYAISKLSMSLCIHGLSQELGKYVSFNAISFLQFYHRELDSVLYGPRSLYILLPFERSLYHQFLLKKILMMKIMTLSKVNVDQQELLQMQHI